MTNEEKILEMLAAMQKDIVAIKEDVTEVKTDVAELKEDVAELGESLEETRSGVNSLLEWAEECGNVIKFPLPRVK